MPTFPLGNPFAKKAAPAKPATAAPQNIEKLTTESGVIPEGVKKKEGDDPMLNFENLWQPNVDKDGKPIKKAGPKQFTPTIEPKAMAAMLDKTDFTKDFTPEEMQAIAKGGDEAVAAIGSMINKATKRSFVMAFSGSQKMMEAAVQAARQDALSEVPNYVRDQMIDSELSRENVLMGNPAYKPMVEHIKRQYQEKFPKASPAEINKGVRAYFDKMVKDMNESTNKVEDPKNDDLVKAGDPNADWADWFELPLPDLQQAGESPNTEEPGVVVPPQT